MKKLNILIFTILIFILLFSVTCYGEDNIYIDSKSKVDASENSDGFIKVKYLNQTTKKLKVIIEKDSEKYTYDLNNNGEYDKFPLQMGDGKYNIKVFENIVDNKYSMKQSVNINVKLKNLNSPFLVPTKYIDFNGTSKTILKANELTKDKETDAEKLDVIYDYIITNIVYDTEKAKTVKSSYVPVIDDVLDTNKGICFDYASTMAAMLRSQSIPAKLVTGYSSQLSVFHAWNEVYLEETGWIVLNKMCFDGNEWKLMDGTIAATGKQSNSEKVKEYINKIIEPKYYTKQFEY